MAFGMAGMAERSSVTGDSSDLFVLDLATLAWNEMTFAIDGTPPYPRQHHGFSSALGNLYIFGGWSDAGLLI